MKNVAGEPESTPSMARRPHVISHVSMSELGHGETPDQVIRTRKKTGVTNEERGSERQSWVRQARQAVFISYIIQAFLCTWQKKRA